MAGLTNCLAGFSSIKVLWIAGNPVTLRRKYIELIKLELGSLKMLDGVNVGKEEKEDTSKGMNNINTLKDLLFAEERERAAKAEAEAANKKGGAKKDDKKPAIDPKKAAADAKTPGKVKGVESSASELKMVHQNSMEFDPLHKKELFEIPEGVKHAYKIRISVKTLEKADSVYFEDLTDEPDMKRENLMASFWIEYDFGSLRLII